MLFVYWRKPLRSIQIVLPLWLVFASSTVRADQVAFKNGDRLTGAILKSDAKSLLMSTAVGGEVTVSWQEIQELRSDLPLHVVLANGKELVGRMTTQDGKLKILTDTGVNVEASKESVVALRNNAEQLAYEKSQHRSLLQGWNGGLDAGVELTRGNSKTRNFRFAFGAVRKVSREELTLSAESLYAIDDVAGARPHVTANVNTGGARLDHDFGSRLFVFANTNFMTDGLQDLNLRSVVGGGVGYHLIKRDKATLNLLGGANFTRENYVEVQRNLAAGQVGEEFTLKVGKSTALMQNLAFFPDLTDSGGNYRTTFSLGTVTKISKWLGWQNNFSDTYVTNPPAGKKQNELVFTSGLHVAFFH
jgi:putative salt-induced outer membrane protein YdiY